jgi:mono/diheme cytochrome c family protein
LVKRLRLGVHEIVSRVPEFVNQLIAALVVFVAISLMACENRSAGVHAAEISQSDHHFGRRVYELNCAVCHGVQGDGNGPAAGMLVTRPRDFRSGYSSFAQRHQAPCRATRISFGQSLTECVGQE